jgi:hypothetical protein
MRRSPAAAADRGYDLITASEAACRSSARKRQLPFKPSRVRGSCRGWLLANDSQRAWWPSSVLTREQRCGRRRRFDAGCLARILARGLNAPQTHRLVRPPGTRQSRGSGSVEVAAIGRTERRPSPAAGRFGLPMRFLARKPPSPHRWRANHRPLRSRTLESALQSVSECPFSGLFAGLWGRRCPRVRLSGGE